MKLLNRLYLFIIKNPIKIGIILLTIFIALLLVFIVSPNLFKNFDLTNIGLNKNESKVDLVGYTEFREAIMEVKKSSQDPKTAAAMIKIQNNLAILEDKKATDGAKLEAVQLISLHISSAYSATGDFSYRKLADETGKFAKANFPEYYNSHLGYFELNCQDPSCADSPPPAEILAVIEAIENSDIQKEIKDSMVENMRANLYLTEKERKLRFYTYMMDLSDIKAYESSSTSKDTSKIYNMLYDYVKKEFPKELDEFMEYQKKQTPNLLKEPVR